MRGYQARAWYTSYDQTRMLTRDRRESIMGRGERCLPALVAGRTERSLGKYTGPGPYLVRDKPGSNPRELQGETSGALDDRLGY
jgi:hypothetical protein